MLFRPINDLDINDVNQVIQLQEDWINSGLLPDTFNRLWNNEFNESTTVVAESQSKIIGYVAFFKKLSHFELDSIFITRNREYKGVGKNLLKYAEKRIRMLGGTKIQLYPMTTNEIKKLITYYENLGYVLIGKILEKKI